MHERALMRDVLARVEQLAGEEGAVRVTRIDVRLGALSHFTPDHFREHFDDASRGTRRRRRARCRDSRRRTSPTLMPLT